MQHGNAASNGHQACRDGCGHGLAVEKQEAAHDEADDDGRREHNGGVDRQQRASDGGPVLGGPGGSGRVGMGECGCGSRAIGSLLRGGGTETADTCGGVASVTRTGHADAEADTEFDEGRQPGSKPGAGMVRAFSAPH